MRQPAALLAPKLSDVPVEALIADPDPHFDRMRARGSAVWVESINTHLVTRFEDIHKVEQNPEIFASTDPGSLMNIVMGHSLMRKDFAPHKRERQAIEPVCRPGHVKAHMARRFSAIWSMS